METNPSAFLPLREPTFFILLSLAQGKKHGYAIMKEVLNLSQGQVSLSTSTLYGALGRLLDQGLVERLEEEVDLDTNRPRKEYILTGLGQQVIEAEFERLQALVKVAQQQLSWEDL